MIPVESGRVAVEERSNIVLMDYGVINRYGQYTQGGYSTHIVVITEDFVVRILDGINLDVAAPLLCTGITTYPPLRHWGVDSGKNIAVVGFGGLGHMV
ncbi:hypothetical protein EL23_17055 [Paenibacillus polymyxa]|nr:hypothetical protein EL23_17055 [Paenibacillus polymyxa]